MSHQRTPSEATLQVVYDVLKLTPFYNAFQVTADAPEIYMQEFWASAYVHNRSVRFKMNNKKHIIGLEQFRDILQICPKVGNKKFVDPPLETEILIFLASLGHSGDIRKLTDVNVNKLHQPWRSFAAVINKCLSGTPSYDSLRLSQAQILWGMYNKKNVDYAYLLWEDFIFKIENKSTKKGTISNDLYYPRSPMALITEDIANSESLQRVLCFGFGTIPFLKTKEARRKVIMMPSRNRSPHAPQGKSEGNWLLLMWGSRAPDYDSEDDISWKSSDDDQEDDEQADDEQADDDDDDEHDDNKKAQDDDDEELD
ncbi:hypothetical protein Tco_0221508 [Tanacetum coccineum]